jgi:hypothetical protein
VIPLSLVPGHLSLRYSSLIFLRYCRKIIHSLTPIQSESQPEKPQTTPSQQPQPSVPQQTSSQVKPHGGGVGGEVVGCVGVRSWGGGG